jgi:CBS domain containing-hemolysin-like protein
LLGHIPRRNEQLRYKDLKIVITEMKGQKIEKILLIRDIPPKTDNTAGAKG